MIRHVLTSLLGYKRLYTTVSKEYAKLSMEDLKRKVTQNLNDKLTISNVKRLIKTSKFIDVNYSRSSGPGGQKVNKVSSKVTLRITYDNFMKLRGLLFDEYLFDNLNSQLTKFPYYTTTGNIVIQSDIHREQLKNLDECISKLIENFKKFGKFNELMNYDQGKVDSTMQKWQRINKSSNEKRLNEKKYLKAKKQFRNKPSID